MADRVKRRLTTVLCADVKSYTHLMARDEAGTLDRLRGCRAGMAALIERHDGRVINTWGDAVIAEFGSVVEAVHCAVEIQKELAARNQDVPEALQMWFRIGINLGDVMVEDGDIYGDGVNIAARLQQLAEPGGITISGPVFDQVRNKVPIGFDYLGPKVVKNVADPVPAFRLVLEGSPSPATASLPFGRGLGQGPQAGDRLAAVWSRFKSWPAAVRISVVVVGFFFAINLFAGLDTIWFQWPSAPLILMILLYFSLRRTKE